MRLMLKSFLGYIKSTILLLTIQGAEILFKALKEGEEVLVILPYRSGYNPFIGLPIPLYVKIIEAYIS